VFYFLVVFIFAVTAGLVPAAIARGMERSFLLWWVYGAFLFVPALVHIVVLKLLKGRKRCLYCGKMVWMNASVCSHCGYEFIKF
jgi:hypothetical protein